MKKIIVTILSVYFLLNNTAIAQQTADPVNVFGKDSDGYKCFRIPSIVKTKKGTLLAFAEARKNSCSDTGDIDLVMKRSTDGGKTWGSMKKIWDDGDNVCGNPAPVVDQATGRILLISTWNRGDDHEKEIIAGTSKDTRRVFTLQSQDDGITWSTPKEITSTTKSTNWTWYATGPCHGIQLQNKKYKNRLVIPANHMVAGTKTYHSHIIYSDDKGETWQLGGVVKEHGGNESTVVELKNGDLLLNMRNYNRDAGKNRSYAISKDGGITWSETRFSADLIEPICQGSILNITRKGKLTDNLLFSNPASVDKRVKMTIHKSNDSGKSWPVSYLVYPGPTAYSDMVMINDKTIGLYYEYGEKNPYENMNFVLIPVQSIK